MKYRTLRSIGRGGMGEVFEAEHLLTGRRVALKVLHEHRAAIPGAVERFVREARLAASIGHPAIVEVLDAGIEPGAAYVAFELLEGESLDERLLRDGPLDRGTALEVMESVLGALAAAHAEGIVHRDVKPANVFLLRDGHTKLLDFGISKIDDGQPALTEDGMVVGTPGYMSPEQARGGPVDARTDIFAAGTLLSHALGDRPGDEVERIVERAVARHPDARYPTATAMLADVRAAMLPTQANATVTREAPLLEPSHEPPRAALTRRWPFFVGPAALLAGAVWVGSSWHPRDHEMPVPSEPSAIEARSSTSAAIPSTEPPDARTKKRRVGLRQGAPGAPEPVRAIDGL